jgi:hypothetical protein
MAKDFEGYVLVPLEEGWFTPHELDTLHELDKPFREDESDVSHSLSST